MAKHVFKTVYAVAIVAGIGKSSGNEYLAVQVSEEATATAGLMKFIPQGTNIYTKISEATKGITNFEYGSDKPNVYPLDESIDLGLGCIFEDTTVPKVKRHWLDADEKEQTSILASVRGVALQGLGETVQGLVQREMIRRCNNPDFTPLRGQDYSSYYFADMTWEEVAKQLFGDDTDSEEPVE